MSVSTFLSLFISYFQESNAAVNCIPVWHLPKNFQLGEFIAKLNLAVFPPTRIDSKEGILKKRKCGGLLLKPKLAMSLIHNVD